MTDEAVFFLITSGKERVRIEIVIHVQDAEDLLRLGFGDDASSVSLSEAGKSRTDPEVALLSSPGPSSSTAKSRYVHTTLIINGLANV